MTAEEKLKEAFRKFNRINKGQIFAAEVISVDESNGICYVNYDGAKIPVMMKSEPDNDGFMFIPMKDSTVIVSKIYENLYVLSMTSQLEKIVCKIGDITFEMNENGLLFNGNSNGGLVKIDPLINAINDIQKDINSLKQAFSLWVVTPYDGGAKLKASATAWSSQMLKTTMKKDLENENIKHG